MKKAASVFSLTVLLMSLCLPRSTWAKTPTVKITISGGGLTSAVEITDPQALALSNVWFGEFLDDSRTPESEPPKGLLPYEVSFFVKLAENDVRKMYVVYYYPSPREQGFVYLPGKGAVWGLNVGTILRKGRDGKWNYASPAWEALIKPALIRAEAALTSTSSPPSGGQKNPAPSASEESEVSVDGWTKPQPGWLYVLDPRSELARPGSRIWLLDPESANVMGSVRAGYDPDFVISPDGSQLYIASGERDSAELAVVDTASGKVLHIPFPDRILYKPWYDGLPPYSRMDVSSDGRALRILVHHIFSPEKIGYQLLTFDTENQDFLLARVHLGNCGYGEFVPSSAASQFDFLCPATNKLRFVQLDSEYRETSNTFVKFPWTRTCGVAQSFLSSDGNKLAIVRTDGAIYEMDLATQEFSPTPVSGDCHGWLVFPLPWPRSPDNAKVYLGYGPLAPSGMATSAELRVFDTTTWRQLGRIQTSVPFWSTAISKDGKLIYALAPEQHRILVIDTATLQERRTIDVGRTPSLALVAP